jgi:hypothetical protein
VIERALLGDNAALRMCIGVLMPRATERPMAFPLPAITSAQDVERAAVGITAAVGTGELTPREALELLRVVDRSMKIVEGGSRCAAGRGGGGRARRRDGAPTR